MSEANREIVFTNVIDFFNETWKNTPKPFKINQRIMKKKHLTSEEALASRNTTTQATEYLAEDGKIRYNKRKLTELPGFISKLTPSLGVLLASKHVYFNYEFSHGQITCSSFMDIQDNLEVFCQDSSYLMNKESKEALLELLILQILFMQCLISMNDFPDSAAIQLFSRTLIFNGFLPNLSEYFSQSDKNSSKHCSLIVPYQYLPPPGMNSVFSLEKHTKPIYHTSIGYKSSIIFTLSNKLHGFNLSGFKTVGEIDLPPLNNSENYKEAIIYIPSVNHKKIENLKLIDGVAVVFSDFSICSKNFDLTLNFVKVFDNAKINRVFIISPNHILVFFDEEKYFEVYNFYNGEMILNQNYDRVIKFMQTDQKPKSNYEDEYFESILNLAAILDNSEIHFYQIKNEIKRQDKHGNEVVILDNFSFNVPGIDCVSCQIVHNNEEDASYHMFRSFFFLSFKDGSMLYLSLLLYEDHKFKCLFLKPMFNKIKKSDAEFKFLDKLGENILLLSESQYIYLMDVQQEECNLIKVCGTYTDGYFIEKNVIVGINKGK